MIWVIANSREEDGTFPTYKHYKNAYPNGAIDIFCATGNDDLSFIKEDDIVLVRTRDKAISECVMEAQNRVGFKSTLESSETEFLTHDKEALKDVLYQCGVAFPKSVSLGNVKDGTLYFVKPRFGENSIGIDSHSICDTREKVLAKYRSLSQLGLDPIIEEYIAGRDLTTTVIRSNDGVKAYSVFTDVDNGNGIQTDETKRDFTFNAVCCSDKALENAAKQVFNAVGAKHHLRIDFRLLNGVFYVIDVNMIPGLAPNGYLSMCLKEYGINYYEAVRMVVNSAD